MSDFLKKIKSVFIVDDASGSATEQPSEKASEKPETKSQAAASVPVEAKGSVSEQFYDLLFSSLEKNNQEGFDYLEFKKSLQSLAKLPMDEATRYQSAYAAAQSMGTTQQRLTDTANIYLKTLKEEESKFQEALSVQRAKQIGDKEKNIQDMELGLKQKGEKIAQLTKDIQEGQAAMEKLKAEISESVLKLDATKNDFRTTYVDLAGQIETDIQKIGQYLK
jgi:uncharacterized protein (DUF3084 family)